MFLEVSFISLSLRLCGRKSTEGGCWGCKRHQRLIQVFFISGTLTCWGWGSFLGF